LDVCDDVFRNAVDRILSHEKPEKMVKRILKAHLDPKPTIAKKALRSNEGSLIEGYWVETSKGRVFRIAVKAFQDWFDNMELCEQALSYLGRRKLLILKKGIREVGDGTGWAVTFVRGHDGRNTRVYKFRDPFRKAEA
jgi:hypothetical protein